MQVHFKEINRVYKVPKLFQIDELIREVGILIRKLIIFQLHEFPQVTGKIKVFDTSMLFLRFDRYYDVEAVF